MITTNTDMKTNDQTTEPTPSPGATCSALDSMLAEWARRERPIRNLQVAFVIHSDTAEDAARELEQLADKIRDGQFTRGTGVGRTTTFAWCAIYQPNAEVSHGDGSATPTRHQS
jgi:hypothetical protein